MADYYTRYSEQITKLTGGEHAWLLSQLIKLEQASTAHKDCGGDAALGFQYEFVAGAEGNSMHFYAEESGEIRLLGEVIQKFLSEFRPDRVFTLTYAASCSSMRIGAFTGGAMVVTAKEIKYLSAENWVRQQVEPPSPSVITVTVEGGIVQGVQNVPEDVAVAIHDYDTDGSEEPGLRTATDGDAYTEAVYEGGK